MVVESASEVMFLTTTLQALLNQSQFLSKIFEGQQLRTDVLVSACLKEKQKSIDAISAVISFLNTFYTWDLLLTHKPLQLWYCH